MKETEKGMQRYLTTSRIRLFERQRPWWLRILIITNAVLIALMVSLWIQSYLAYYLISSHIGHLTFTPVSYRGYLDMSFDWNVRLKGWKYSQTRLSSAAKPAFIPYDQVRYWQPVWWGYRNVGIPLPSVDRWFEGSQNKQQSIPGPTHVPYVAFSYWFLLLCELLLMGVFYRKELRQFLPSIHSSRTTTLVLLALLGTGCMRDPGSEAGIDSSAGSQIPSASGSQSFDERAIVLLDVSLGEGPRLAVGFAFGDGTLVATARHCIASRSRIGKHDHITEPYVISPYYGDKYPSVLVADDPECDVAILRVNWPEHPALQIALDEILSPSDSLTIVSYEQSDGSFQPSLLHDDVQITSATVECKLEISPGQQTGKGWSGAPVISKSSGDVVALFHSRLFSEQQTRHLYATGASALEGLLHTLPATVGKKPGRLLGDATENEKAFALIIKCIDARMSADYPSALSMAEQYVEIRPESAPGHRALALAASEIGDASLALQQSELALQLEPNSAISHGIYAQALCGMARWNDASVEYLRALEINPTLLPAVNGLVNVEINQRRFDSVITLLSNSIRNQPNNAYLWYMQAEALERMRKPNEGIESMKKAVELYPEQPAFRARIASMLASMNRRTEAIEQFRELTTVAPKEASTWFVTAQFLAANEEDWPEARYDLDFSEFLAEQHPFKGRISAHEMDQVRMQLQKYSVIRNGDFEIGQFAWQTDSRPAERVKVRTLRGTAERPCATLWQYHSTTIQSPTGECVLHQTFRTVPNTSYNVSLYISLSGEGASAEVGWIDGAWPGEMRSLYRSSNGPIPWSPVTEIGIMPTSDVTTLYLRFVNQGPSTAEFCTDGVRVFMN